MKSADASPWNPPAAGEMVRQQLEPRGIDDRAVLEAMARLPRHLFVPHATIAEAYADRAMATAEGQTISQPYMVALMTQLLAVRRGRGQRVLEVGTGSGYQTGLLALLGAQVVTVEQSRWLAAEARRVLESLGLADGIVFVVGDGTLGYPAGAPYDRILVTAGAPHVPPAYRDQLAQTPGSRLVIPVGDRREQRLNVLVRQPGGSLATEPSVACRFVPLVGEAGWGGGEK